MKEKKILNCIQRLYLKALERNKNWQQEHWFPGGMRFPDKTFYIIRRSGMKLGLFSYFNTHLARMDYAIQNGMIPVVDMQNFRNSYLEEDEYALVNEETYEISYIYLAYPNMEELVEYKEYLKLNSVEYEMEDELNQFTIYAWTFNDGESWTEY